MPRAWTDEEHARIRDLLMREGRALFVRHGLAKVTIAELARAAGIGKGSFYLLFDSKESLFFAIHEREELRYRAAVEAELAPFEARGDGAGGIGAFARAAAVHLRDEPFLRLLTEPGTVLALQRRLDPAVLEANREGDQAWIGGLLQRWKAAGMLPADLDEDLVFGCFAAFFALSLNADVVGPRFEEVVDQLARGLAATLT
ncbi:MAG: TetR/AcrR family transcriptional regulator [Deltaproteobacteria bacterium]|nr:MAG: TetR/AcrR family transcriptional regulator [Deltaproteobacteria bacterium]